MSHQLSALTMKANLKNEKFFLALIKKGLLRVTKNGRAFNVSSGKEVATNKVGYRKISWLNKITGKIVQVQLHRLVWANFKGLIPDPELEINHKDGDKGNCALRNLEVTTSRGNIAHARANKLLVDPKGEKRPNAIFKDAQVVRLRQLYDKGRITATQVKHKFGCSMSVACSMLKGGTYKHLGR